MAAGIASGFVRKLYRILDQENEAIVGWDATGLSFSIHDSQQLNDVVLPRYFRGRMSAFRQQLLDHGFEQIECEDNEARECYAHPHFLRGCPDRLSYIVRVPKPKLKPGQTSATPPQPAPQPHPQQQQQQRPAHQSLQQHTNGYTHQQPQQPSLGIRIAPSARGPGRTPLTVTLTAAKRASPMHNTTQADFSQKRLRGTSPPNHAYNASGSHADSVAPPQRPTGIVPAPPPPANLNRNPLFSNDTSSDLGLDVARVFSLSRISDSGLLPNSTDLPEPISYLTKLLHGNSSSGSTSANANASAAAAASSSSMESSTATPSDPPMFSEDLMKSALYFLVSTSTTGVGPGQDTTDSWAARMERASTSGFLSSLLVSSATGKDVQNGGGGALSSSSVWGSQSTNPLFSRSTEQDEEEDSIWSLLLASSIDRVKTSIQVVTSPQERLKLILEERERLEVQRKRIYGQDSEEKASTASTAGGPHKPTTTQSTKPLKSALKKPAATNPLFSGGSKPKTLLFTQTSSGSTGAPTPQKAKSSNPLFSNDSDDDNDDDDGSGPQQNPLFAKPSATAVNPLFSKESSVSSTSSTASTGTKATSTATRPPGQASAAEDGLWRLLMTSSVDWLRKGAAEFEV